MIFYKTSEEIELSRLSNLLVSKTLGFIGGFLKVGKTSLEIDSAAEEFIRDHGGIPGFKGYRGFPASLCISINDSVVHGIPDNHTFKPNDVISVDCGVLMNGFYGDAAYTFAFEEVTDEVINLLITTRQSLNEGIQKCVVGNRIGDISYAIQQYCEVKHPYGVVRELVGHGVGRNLHEEPEVPNFGIRGKGPMLKEGMILAIEPMVNMGTRHVKQSNDGWTITTRDGKPSAHFEHSVAVTQKGPDILSDHSFAKLSIKNNTELKDF